MNKPATTDFRAYYFGLSKRKRQEFANRAGYDPEYIRDHLASIPPRRIPDLRQLRKLAEASRGDLSIHQIMDHFENRDG